MLLGYWRVFFIPIHIIFPHRKKNKAAELSRFAALFLSLFLIGLLGCDMPIHPKVAANGHRIGEVHTQHAGGCPAVDEPCVEYSAKMVHASAENGPPCREHDFFKPLCLRIESLPSIKIS